ncbi:MAG: class F420-dependent oxidoreductase [Marmoricola sp.]|nr:class F420-dependent oxidoreductase [Marmoricola sp.]
MRLGLHLVNHDFDQPVGTALAEIGTGVEEAGFDNLSVMDHFVQLEFMGPPSSAMLEGYTTLGFLAAHTTTVDLQLLVTGITYRHPGVLGKIVATLDNLSGGRAVLGLGAAWYEREHQALGVPFPPLAERFERLEETVQVLRQMWSPDDGPYVGQHYRLAETVCSPQPLRPVPLMIGGSGEQRTLRLVAQYADAANLFANADLGPDEIARKLAVLDRHCAELERDPTEVARTILWTGDCDPTDFVETMRPYADLGISEVHVMRLGSDPLSLVRALAPQVGDLHAL